MLLGLDFTNCIINVIRPPQFHHQVWEFKMRKQKGVPLFYLDLKERKVAKNHVQGGN